MKTKTNLFLLSTAAIASASVVGGCAGPKTTSKEANKTPNVIFILADDLGYGDIGVYGQTKIETPNIDRLASQGLRYTQHYSGSTVSAPSRSSLLTGLHTGHTPIRGNRELVGEGQEPMPGTTYTMAEMFKGAGYSTAVFGKWGLGFTGSEGDPNMQGFDEFFGYNCQRQAHRYYPKHLWHNQDKVYLEGNDFTKMTTYAPDVIHEKAMNYITEKSKSESPFFVYLALVQPHAELLAPEDEILEKYRARFEEEKPYVSPQPNANYGSENFDFKYYNSQPEPRAHFAAMVERLDGYVGDVMAKLEELGIDDNTIVIFSSDNGAHVEGGADIEFFNSNGSVTGHKRTMTDGGIRTPMIVRWGDIIKAGSVTEHISAFWDVMPTMADILDVELPKTDGISMLNEWKGKKQEKHDYLYWEYAAGKGETAVRIGDFKAIRSGLNKKADAKIALYDLKKDPKELTDVSSQHPDLINQVKEIMKKEHTPSEKYPFGYEKNKK